MKRLNVLLLVISLSLLIASCKQCPKRKELTPYGFLDEMNAYFGMYQSDNWWVYKNNKSTKTDSVFVSDFSEVTRMDRQLKCITYPDREFTLHTNYIDDGKTKELKGEYSNNASCCDNIFLCVIGAKMDSNINNHPVSTVPPAETIVDSISINGMLFHNAILFQVDNNKLIFAPGVGIVRFVNTTDTFNLTKYFIK